MKAQEEFNIARNDSKSSIILFLMIQTIDSTIFNRVI